MATKRVKEDFSCENCGCSVAGDGYTNHCPACMWSKHVDIEPGDRLSECGGLMKPTRAETSRDVFRVIHECVECGYEKANRMAKNDDISVVLSIPQPPPKAS